MRLRKAQLGLMIVTLVAGCSDPKTPNEVNFRKALQSYMASHPSCTSALIGDAKPGTTLTYRPGPLDEDYLDLQTAGAVEIKEVPAEPDKNGVVPKDPGHSVTILNSDIWQKGKGFCYGNYIVDKIVRWSEPASIEGVKVSRVTYHRTFVSAKWATTRFLKYHYITNEETKEATLILMNDGWQIPDGERL